MPDEHVGEHRLQPCREAPLHAGGPRPRRVFECRPSRLQHVVQHALDAEPEEPFLATVPGTAGDRENRGGCLPHAARPGFDVEKLGDRSPQREGHVEGPSALPAPEFRQAGALGSRRVHHVPTALPLENGSWASHPHARDAIEQAFFLA
ncbi:MAG: hypothetical protein EHM24_23430 [Acidobacteria bacterium]|nr:MAG: hypothetical protein EHM24_23430 [Acidobacteriota bacterium]